MRPILEVAQEVGLSADEIETHGPYVAKVRLDAASKRTARGRVVLVTAINPTPAGEGKTVTVIALSQGLRKAGRSVIACLREPSLGPVFGRKGGATGGGKCTVEPSVQINLHFTGDFHAITTANNLLVALADDHLFRDAEPRLDPRKIAVHRAMDVTDRALRRSVVGLEGTPREGQFWITAASEVMAILTLSKSWSDLKERLGRMVVGQGRDGKPVTAAQIGAAGAMTALLRDALLPNLVQTQEGGPALVHCGPFANIAHGTCSLVSLELGQALADIVVVEAGFGSDLGAEKFVNLVGAHGGPHPDVAVIVATVKALRHHGQGELKIDHLEAHVANVRKLGMRPVVCINRFRDDSAADLAAIRAGMDAIGVGVAECDGFAQGGEGALELAAVVQQALEQAPLPRAPSYDLAQPYTEKLTAVAQSVYGAAGVEWGEGVKKKLAAFEAQAPGLPVCVAKTQYSFSDDGKKLGVPRDFTFHIRDVELRAGAGFVVALAGSVLTMPGFPDRANAQNIDLDPDGTIRGVS